jgi:outer membrane protein assembly factor BamA
MKILALLLVLLCCSTCYSKQLNFDENGNLIDSSLDKKYNIMSYYSFISATHDVYTPGFEVTFRHYRRWNFNLGFGYKLYYSDLTYSLYKNKLCLGLIAGYSTKAHNPVYGLALTWRVF